MQINRSGRLRGDDRDARRVRATLRLRDISTYDEYARALDRALENDALFERIRHQGNTVRPRSE